MSAETDLVVGIVISGVGVDAVRHVRRPAQWPLAALPLVFGVHQLIETVVWWSLEGHLPTAAGRVATWAYLIVAFVLPLLVPIGAARYEPEPRRRELMWVFAALGAVVSAALLVALFRSAPDVTEGTLHLDYHVATRAGGALAVFYVVATCGAFLASSDRRIALVGLLNLVAVTLLAWLLVSGVISLWCFWAAVVSFLIAADLRATARREDATPATRSGNLRIS